MPTDEERMAFKRQEREAAASIMAGDRYCPDPELHELVARAASQERPSIDVERLATTIRLDSIRNGQPLSVEASRLYALSLAAEYARLSGPVGE